MEVTYVSRHDSPRHVINFLSVSCFSIHVAPYIWLLRDEGSSSLQSLHRCENGASHRNQWSLRMGGMWMLLPNAWAIRKWLSRLFRQHSFLFSLKAQADNKGTCFSKGSVSSSLSLPLWPCFLLNTLSSFVVVFSSFLPALDVETITISPQRQQDYTESRKRWEITWNEMKIWGREGTSKVEFK